MKSILRKIARPVCGAIALPWGRLELPGWPRVLYHALGYDRREGLPVREVRGKLHGYTMRLETADWAERWTYHLGRYYETHTQLLLQAALRPGDTFVDVGANVGMISLLASRLVGPAGRVVSFEPNPVVYQRLRGHIDANRLGELVTTHNMALGERDETLTLRVPTQHTGLATLGQVREEFRDQVSAEYSVAVKRGDEVLAGPSPGEVFIKIDVEGFECSVLRGLEGVIRARRPAIVTEAIDEHLRGAGSSLTQLFGVMHGLGLHGYSVDADARLLGARHTLRLRRCETPQQKHADDVLWLTPGGAHEERLRRFLA